MWSTKNHRQIGGDFQSCGPEEDRTPEPSDANRTLSQLSYGPILPLLPVFRTKADFEVLSFREFQRNSSEIYSRRWSMCVPYRCEPYALPSCALSGPLMFNSTEPYFYQLPHISKSAGPVVILSYVGIISSYTLLFSCSVRYLFDIKTWLSNNNFKSPFSYPWLICFC